VCPVKIDIPKILLELRSDVKKAETRDGQNRVEKLGFRAFAWLMTHPRIYEMAGKMLRSVGVPSIQAGPLRAWTSQRDLPALPSRSFREMWRRR
jgi:L-lactate dehydrogenase complex protein LldF